MALLKTDQNVPLQADSHGVMRVGNTRVSLDSIIYTYQDGATAEQIAEEFPTVELADIHILIGFYLRHETEVTQYLKAQEQRADEVRRKVEPIVAKGNVRQRLLARKVAREGTHVAAGE